MLSHFRNHIAESLEDYINAPDSSIDEVELNLGFSDNSTTPWSLGLSIIRIEEEASMKNFPNQQLRNTGASYQIDKRFPKVYLNYYLMFSSGGNYGVGTEIIHRVIRYFQAHKQFRFDIGNIPSELNLSLFTPSFEQLSHIWGINEGKQYPAVFYKARLVELEYDEEQLTSVVESVNTKILTAND